MNPQSRKMWRTYLDSLSEPQEAESSFYEEFRIGSSAESANEGARLILQGTKTATSSLLWEYEDDKRPLPYAGSLSILLDGDDKPVCVVETTAAATKPFDEVDADFARQYGEGDRTLEGWRRLCWEDFSAQCTDMGRLPSEDMPLVCEHIRVIFP